MYVYIYYIYILKYNQFSLYNVTCMHVLGADYLALGIQLGKNTSPTPNCLQLPIILYDGLRLHGLHPISFGILLVSSLSVILGQLC